MERHISIRSEFDKQFLKYFSPIYRQYPTHLHETGDYISDSIRKRKTFYELPLLHFLRKQTSFDKVIDVGANLGNHSRFFSLFGGEVFSIEPIKRNFALLTKNAPESKKFNIGVGKEPATLEFATYPSNFGGSYSLNAFDGVMKDRGSPICKETVEIVTIDSLDISSPSLIKMDIEGSELDALLGAEKTLTNARNVHLCIEIFSDELLESEQFPYTRDDIEFVLKDYGFKFQHQINSSNVLFHRK